MKKVFALLAISGMLVACGGNSSQTSEEAVVEETAVEVDSTTLEGNFEDDAVETSEELVEEAPASAE